MKSKVYEAPCMIYGNNHLWYNIYYVLLEIISSDLEVLDKSYLNPPTLNFINSNPRFGNLITRGETDMMSEHDIPFYAATHKICTFSLAVYLYISHYCQSIQAHPAQDYQTGFVGKVMEKYVTSRSIDILGNDGGR